MIRDVLDNGTLRKEITFTVKPAFLKHLEFLARIESNRAGHVVTVEQYLFSLAAEKVRSTPAPTQTKEEVELIAGQ